MIKNISNATETRSGKHEGYDEFILIHFKGTNYIAQDSSVVLVSQWREERGRRDGRRRGSLGKNVRNLYPVQSHGLRHEGRGAVIVCSPAGSVSVRTGEDGGGRGRTGEDGGHHGRAPAEENVLQAQRKRQKPQEDKV